MMKIPSKNKDLRRYVLKNDLVRGVLFLMWMALWISGVTFYNHRNASVINPTPLGGWKLWVLLAAITLVGFFLFRLQNFFKDRTFSGKIISSDLLHDYSSSKDPGTSKPMQYDFRLNTAIRVLDKKQKKHRLLFEQKNGFYTYYHEGTEIVHFRGLPYPVRTDEAEGYICAACGRIQSQLEPSCEDCGHSLIDPKDLNS